MTHVGGVPGGQQQAGHRAQLAGQRELTVQLEPTQRLRTDGQLA